MTDLEKAMLKFDEIINRPSHYNTGEIEVWDFIIDQDMGYLDGNVIKYVCRAGKKEGSDYLTDIKKARAYLNKIIEVCER